MSVISYIVLYLVTVNLTGLIVMGVDKLRAKKRAWRIPEATLFVIALIGGSLGATIGMHLFHHKTRHWYFLFGMPAILVIQIAIVLLLIYSPIEFAFL
ncbi:MAG: DUF1294 domain-containing protein [Clostridium sp.]|nr:DUF1294 domain-containing protein [Clostridium sp.]MCM1388543.1 DUF1294 domain-containing protein [Bacillus sp. (in: firmicutes)]MCM1427973.1 DUF1294 domain-containing protein [Eubacterium sp.]